MRAADVMVSPPTLPTLSPDDELWPALEHLRRAGVLYERDSKGEFLHAYSAPFEDRFEFEFVERRGSYDLYGRLVARHLGKHIPGHPIVVAQNMPGAGSLKAANYIYDDSTSPSDLCTSPLRQCGSGNLYGGNEPARTWFTAMKPIANNWGDVHLPPTDPTQSPSRSGDQKSHHSLPARSSRWSDSSRSCGSRRSA